MYSDMSNLPCLPSFLPLCCLSASLSGCFFARQPWCGYHGCMHHGLANKLHRVATLLPLSLSCQVEPLKHSPSSPLHFYPSIPPSSVPLPATLICLFTLVLPSHNLLDLYTHRSRRSDLFDLASMYPTFFYHPIWLFAR